MKRAKPLPRHVHRRRKVAGVHLIMRRSANGKKAGWELEEARIMRLKKMAPAAGFEPATKWLTATYSTTELCRSMKKQIVKHPRLRRPDSNSPGRISNLPAAVLRPSIRLGELTAACSFRRTAEAMPERGVIRASGISKTRILSRNTRKTIPPQVFLCMICGCFFRRVLLPSGSQDN